MILLEDIGSFEERFPQMQQVPDSRWRGSFPLHATFGGVTLQDAFEIEIEIPSDYPSCIPKLYEVGGRTEAIARKHQIQDIRDLHRDVKTGAACVCVKQEEVVHFPPGSTLNIFVDHLVTPYLYGLAYFDQNRRWPWGEYSHGALGILESIAYHGVDPSIETIKGLVAAINKDPATAALIRQLYRLSENRHCPCGRLRPFRRCHATAWQGLLQLRRAMAKLGLDARELFAACNTQSAV